jgi:putative DNA primase/helicase
MPNDQPSPTPPLRPLSASELMAMDLPAPRPILESAHGPLLTSKSLALLHGPRGIGKSLVALGIAWAAATGGRFLGWQAPQPRRVTYIDGEMAAAELRERMRLFGRGPETMPGTMPDTLTFLLGDLHSKSEGLPDLGTLDGQYALLKQWTDWPDLLVLDNLASLVAPRYAPRQGGADHWSALQRLLLHLRRRGTAVLIVHHSDRAGQPRGTSRREELLDLVLALRKPRDYAPSDGARFEIHVEKARGLWGDAVAPIEARLARDPTQGDAGGTRWQWRPAQRGELDRVAALLKDGLNPNQIARELGISKSRSYRLRERVVGLGNS